ncbi:amidohydrolase family protein [Aquipuribacter nitratireducens]|uniref:Amidohydrolase family protein n=1 Tax=Aquipuribacter nitratireducens TaxID=650104 RepID=A0ABW0GH51_9MICO
MPERLPPGRPPVVDTHAHLLPREVWHVPGVAGGVRDVDGWAHLGDFPMAVEVTALADVEVLLADMDRQGIDVRVVSPPPYAFQLGAPEAGAGQWCAEVTAALVRACRAAPHRLVPFGTVPVVDEAAAVSGVRSAVAAGARGIALPPLVGDVPVGEGAGRAALLAAAAAAVPVLLHPVQAPGPGLGRHYLRNLLGNPVETAVGVASLLFEELTGTPGLRVLAVHGGGCVPAVVGRWDHGWRVRPETGPALADAPSRLLRAHEVYADLLTHDPATAAATTRAFGAAHVVLGSDYPFDMGCVDPVGAARTAGADLAATSTNALRWLHGSAPAPRPHTPQEALA